MALLFSYYFSEETLAQDDECSKPKVDVRINEIHDRAFELLDQQKPGMTAGWWYSHLQSIVFDELKRFSSETQFIPDCGKECDYYFTYLLNTVSIEEEEGISYLGFLMISHIGTKARCEEAGRMIHYEVTMFSRDLYQTIRNIASHGKIGSRIEEYEKKHPVQPRGGKIELSQNRDYVSPMPDEKKLDIKIDMTNCKGKPVYERTHGHKIELPCETDTPKLQHS